MRYKGGVISATAPTISSSAASGLFTLPQQLQALAAGNWPATLPAIGSAFGGGFFAGQISTAGNGIADYNLVVGPKASAQVNTIWKNAQTATPGADSTINGTQNTADMVADGNSTVYPAAHFCNDLVIGGFSDWYMPAKKELEVFYYNLKPTTTSNNTGSGANTNAVPSRGSNYTTGNPAQTSVADFITSTGSEAFTADRYWSSTEQDTTRSNYQSFSNGLQDYQRSKNYSAQVRAIRRVAV
jgi:hypothetical protein